jgi:stearoyl-CoA desaturase (Delta-9 desaturase)
MPESSSATALTLPTAPAPDTTKPRPRSLVEHFGFVVLFLVPFLAVPAALFLSWERGFRWVEMAVLFGMYLLTGLGITVGYHRLFTHRSFETGGVIRFLLAVLGSMAL